MAYFQENKKSLVIHIVETFGEQFKSIQTFGVVEMISLRYAQYHEAPDDYSAERADRERFLLCVDGMLIIDNNRRMDWIDGDLALKKWILWKRIISMEMKMMKTCPVNPSQLKKSIALNHSN
jgi:hypothetical protein